MVQQIELIENRLMIKGKVNFENATVIYQQGVSALKVVQKWPVMIDLSQVEQGNTLLLAMILQWLRQCPAMDSLQLTQVPAKMQGILQASHLESLVFQH